MAVALKLIVTDLDNTLYDWVGFFVPAFYAMAEEASRILNVDLDLLLDDLKIVHQRHGSSEHPFALLEASLVNDRLGELNANERRERLDPAFHRFNAVRKQTLQLYDGVIDTLRELLELGIVIVAYTDARIPNSLYRLHRLGLSNYISRLYAPAARFPNDRDLSSLSDGTLKVLPEKDRKPNPKALLDICRDLEVNPSDTLYVGDSLSRDIFMANTAGVPSAWAKYGTQVDPSLWTKLVRVTHWTSDDVQNEVKLKNEAAGARPDKVLSNFTELLAVAQGYI